MLDIPRMRQVIIDTIPGSSSFGEPPIQTNVYLPSAHTKALRLESNLVVGSRGVGKTFWAAVLQTPSLLSFLGRSLRDLENVEAVAGYSSKDDIDRFPDSGTFTALLENKECTPHDIWRAVIVRWLKSIDTIDVPSDTWDATVQWVRSHPEQIARLVSGADQRLQQEGRRSLIVFDALDRTSSDWQTMDKIVRDLLRCVLWLKPYRSLHAKVFLRIDQFDRTVTNFPDASKLLATKTELFWEPHDLHGLLWQLLCNAYGDDGIFLRRFCADVTQEAFTEGATGWQLPDRIKRNEEKLRGLFEALAGKWMGTDVRRGVPYVWIVSHLADGNKITSPRSFLEAIRAATEDSVVRYPDHGTPLHYESIKRGVQKASSIRISEIAEDYPWIRDYVEPLRGFNVPCRFSDIELQWNESLKVGVPGIMQDRLPPEHLANGWPGIRKDLERIGLFVGMKDGRINMPDLYRIGFGLGRKGGVKPN